MIIAYKYHTGKVDFFPIVYPVKGYTKSSEIIEDVLSIDTKNPIIFDTLVNRYVHESNREYVYNRTLGCDYIPGDMVRNETTHNTFIMFDRPSKTWWIKMRSDGEYPLIDYWEYGVL